MSSLTTSPASALSQGTEDLLDDDENEKTNLSLVFHRYKDRFMNLPKDKGWMSEDQYLYQGHWFPSKYLYSIETVMAAQDAFQANPSDIYLVTTPKSGTTWLKALTFAIVNRTRYDNNSLSTHPLLISNPHACVPFIEREILRSRPTYTDADSPGIFATHMPFTSLPQSILDSGCRLVYMCRNPKDVLVSLFHFLNKYLRDDSLGLLTLEEAVEMFSKGKSPSGTYWDHVKGYYNASLQQPTRILFLTYENMKMDTANHVKRMAEFLGYPFTKEEEAKGVVQEIVSLCSFKNLSEVNKHGDYRKGVPNNAFFREGEIGDWTNHLNDKMRQTLDRITEEKFYGLDIVF